jgi:hypothetical protein
LLRLVKERRIVADLAGFLGRGFGKTLWQACHKVFLLAPATSFTIGALSLELPCPRLFLQRRHRLCRTRGQLALCQVPMRR